MGVKIASMVLAGYLFLVCSALPAIKDQVEYVPAVKTHGDQPIIDTGYFSDWENPFSGSFGGLFDNIESIMDRMRKQIASILQRFPLAKGGNSTGELPDFSSLGGPFPQIGDIDLSKGNTTSVTKVINGHKVIINETEYKNEDANGGTFFKVRIVDVAPDSNEATTEKDVDTPNEAREAIDNSFENEIPKSKEAEPLANTHEQMEQFNNIETFDEIDSGNKKPTPKIEFMADEGVRPIIDGYSNPLLVPSQEWNDIDPIQSIDSNNINQEEETAQIPQLPIDLSRDTYVNEIMARKNAPTDPDAEVFFVPEMNRNKMMDPR